MKKLELHLSKPMEVWDPTYHMSSANPDIYMVDMGNNLLYHRLFKLVKGHLFFFFFFFY